eukprot:CAMPEP_0113484348 /NCGR_PEP_ID=MMETSP0014_2-20120614/23914_1 /TAXON_ID=2857 /ORGANISM="Nitzschia sp." /LENGTH=732 /DNA_ID=CAMNT_0000377945 /DNA_START=302 /DNA_END=2500 /DNA_ORIENTATION=- /assembly_acc=CAM_ASM_000159
MKISIVGPFYGLLMAAATTVAATTQDHLLRVSTNTKSIDLATILAEINDLKARVARVDAQDAKIGALEAKVERLEMSQESHRRRLEEVEFASDECTPALRTEFLKNETTDEFILDFNGDKIVERRACVFPPVGRYEFIDNFVKFDGRVDFNNDVTFDDNVTFSDFVHFDDTDGIYFRGHNPINGDITLNDDLSVKGNVYTYGDVEFHTGDHDEITFKGSGEVYFNDHLHVVSQGDVEWSFDGDGDVEFVNNKVTVDTHERLDVKVNTNFRKSVYVSNDFHVDGHTYLDGSVTIEGLLTANGGAVVQDGSLRRRQLETDGQKTDGDEGDRELIAAGCALQVNGDSCVAGNLDVAGDITGVMVGTFPPFTAPPTTYPAPAPEVTADKILELLRGQPLEVASIWAGAYSRRDLSERKLMAPGTIEAAGNIQAATIEATNTIMAGNSEVVTTANMGDVSSAASNNGGSTSTTCDCESEISELKADISGITTDLSTLTANVAAASSSANSNVASTSTACDCESEISALKAELSSDISDITIDLRDLTKEVGWNSGNITRVEGLVTSSSSSSSSSSSTCDCTSEIGDLTTSVGSLETRMDAAEEDIDTLEASSSNTGATDNGGLAGQVSTLEDSVNTLTSGVGSLETRMDNAEEGIGALEASSSNTGATNNGGLAGQVSALEDSVKTLTSDVGNLKTSVAETGIAPLEGEVSGLTGQVSGLAEEVSGLTKRVDALENA